MLRPRVARGFVNLADCGLASMYPASAWSVLCSGPSWISARIGADWQTGLERAIQVTSVRMRGKTILHRRLILSQASAGKGVLVDESAKSQRTFLAGFDVTENKSPSFLLPLARWFDRRFSHVRKCWMQRSFCKAGSNSQDTIGSLTPEIRRTREKNPSVRGRSERVWVVGIVPSPHPSSCGRTMHALEGARRSIVWYNISL